MRIDATSNNLYANQRAQLSNADRNAAGSFSMASSTATTSDAADVKQPDFSNMTGQEMRDWTNNQIRSGEMSLDDGFSFFAMTMKIPVGSAGAQQFVDDGEHIDFTQKVQAGIEGALSRHDDATLEVLQSAMKIMQEYQGQATGA
jgi:hypothetical protein